MKLYLLILFITFTVKSEAQTEFESFLKYAKKINLPYSSISESDDLEKTKKVLHASDSLFIITKLNRKEPKAVNLYGNSPFGQIDCEETISNMGQTEINDCLKISEMKEIAILSYIKINNNHYLLHLELTKKGEFGESKGILVSMNENGDVMDWLFSNGSANSGNPNGNVRRDFTVQKDFTLDIDETSWGNNNVSYAFNANYEIINYSIENSDFIVGEFNLKNLTVKY
ncbi:hypothetical protein WMW71_06435 [Flavobacterium buctense]|uniref:Uncharacterized protein n=1 Tax=Flavobacterium buctense TaxID=1648146 RepID=A0ABU9E1S3_9FLAO|nr:hypothetical protein [Flavobacterium buctense]